jgi:hypothetical protein
MRSVDKRWSPEKSLQGFQGSPAMAYCPNTKSCGQGGKPPRCILRTHQPGAGEERLDSEVCLSVAASPQAKPGERVDPNRRKIAGAIKLLLSTLSPDEQDRVLQEIIEAIRPIPAPRAGEVLGSIVRFLPRRVEWTVDEIKHEVAALRIEATPKEIYNSLGYLVRKGRVRRVGYGRYLVDGAELRTLDDLALPPARDEDC